MIRFPQIATNVGMAEFSVRENVVGPDDDEDKDDDRDGEENGTLLVTPEES